MAGQKGLKTHTQGSTARMEDFGGSGPAPQGKMPDYMTAAKPSEFSGVMDWEGPGWHDETPDPQGVRAKLPKVNRGRR
jgi:hypothetical protein